MPTPSSKAPEPQRLARALGLVAAAALLLASATASAQVDVFPPLDNVMLLVDTSGSMEFQFSGSEVTCTANNVDAANDRSRWVHLVEALTGTIQNYACETIDRSDNIFAANGEYALGGVASYDFKHPIPFHRALSSGCAVRPGALPNSANVFQYPSPAVSYKHYDSDADCSFAQASDGVIDAFASEVRFGLMTFDSLTDAGTGVSGTAADLASGVAGTWSYYPGFLSSTDGKAMGAARECTKEEQEVGARNGGAPPWEGRMMNFGDPARGALAHLTKAQRIQEILLSTRPFGATPIAGMLRDAETFFFEDDSADHDGEPTSPSDLKYSPKTDPYVKDGCREQFIVLITDGHPNLDLRPDCLNDSSCDPGDPDCKCPYDTAEDIALRLASSTTKNKRVPVYVVAMALEQFDYNGDTVSCSTMDEQATLEAACADAANSSNRPLQACCSLQRIAESGKHPDDKSDTAGDAIFVDSPDELRSALSRVLSKGLPDSSRTQPVFSGAGGSVLTSHRFYSSYIPKELQPWEGRIERERYECKDDGDPSTPQQPTPLDIDPAKGDDFAANLNSAVGPARRFYTVIGEAPVDSRATIRPYIGDGATPDGIPNYGGTIVTGTDELATVFSAEVPPAAMELPNGSCSLSDTACRDRYLKWLIGLPNGTSDRRCKAKGDPECALLGDVFHSTPRVVNRPLAVLRDETYSKFASIHATRPAVLYTSTNDGFLHAFKTLSNDDEADENDAEEHVMTLSNNELWAFIPPAILPDLDSLYPHSHQFLLDGAPVVKDVVAVVNEDDPDEIFFVRTQETAQQGNSSWRTVLLQSFGRKRSGYFAVDITQPVPVGDPPGQRERGRTALSLAADPRWSHPGQGAIRGRWRHAAHHHAVHRRRGGRCGGAAGRPGRRGQ